MKTIIRGLLTILATAISVANADVLGDEDDIYFGIRVSTSIDSISRSAVTGQHQFSYLLLQQRHGVKDGLVLTQNYEGTRTLSYLRPSESFDIGRSMVIDYSLPILRMEAEESGTEDSGSGNTDTIANGMVVLVGVAGLAALASMQLKSDLEDDWEYVEE